MTREPQEREVWMGNNGRLYRVLLIVNLKDSEHYPKMVVIRDIQSGTEWATSHKRWADGFIFHSAPFKPKTDSKRTT